MKNKTTKKLPLLLIIFFGIIGFSKPAHAVVPPDFIFSIGSQIIQIFSLIIIFLSATFSLIYQFVKDKLILLNKWHWIILVIFIIGVSGGSAFFYSQNKQKQEYTNWLIQSEKYDKFLKQGNEFETVDKLKIRETQEEIVQPEDNDTKLISDINTELNDKSVQFIEEYYGNIGNQNLEAAYAMSKKVVDLQTFKSWYVDTTKITVDNITRIDNTKSSLELTLYEGNNYTRYGVLMTLLLENGIPLQVEKSEVRILNQGLVVVNTANTTIQKQITKENNNFFTENQNTNIVINNQDFETITNSDKNNYIVLDARENLEYKNGHFPQSIHIRFADLQAGRWIELPTDKNIYVLCWSGIRGKEVAEFLRTKNLVASYLEQGANGWVEYGGDWIGNIKFSEKYSEERFRIVLDTKKVKKMVSKNEVVLVDSREHWKFQNSSITNSINFPIMHTPTTKLESVFNQFKPKSKVIIICDDYVNCFDAKITGVELEARGHQMIGRYTKPWEY